MSTSEEQKYRRRLGAFREEPADPSEARATAIRKSTNISEEQNFQRQLSALRCTAAAAKREERSPRGPNIRLTRPKQRRRLILRTLI